MSKRNPLNAAVLLATLLLFGSFGSQSNAQGIGVELHNTVMPASGGMGGVSIANPQDLPSALHGNPATLSQFGGTHFTFSGTWLEPTFKMRHTAPPGGVFQGVGSYRGKSSAQGSALGNIAVSQDLRPLGIPGTFGVGLIAASGAGNSFRHIPASNGTSAFFNVLEITPTVGLELTERLSAGANLMLGNSTLDGPFVGLTGAAYDYALRGAIGLNYDIAPATKLGVYYQTKQSFTFDQAAIIQLPMGGTVTSDIRLDLPSNVGIGISDESLMCGRLLLAVDVLYKNWDNTDLFGVLYDDQWVLQFGAQYKVTESLRVRAGYVYAENATQANPGNSAGGVTPPGAQAAIRYVQSLFPNYNKHRISFGVGMKNILPNIDLDLNAGGMFEEAQQFGQLTSTSLASYWIGTGLTWHFGGSSCDCGEGMPCECAVTQ